jgi:hypothetical protein
MKASLNLKYRYIDDVFSLNNSRLGDRVDRIYAIELEIKNTTDTDRSDSKLFVCQNIYIGFCVIVLYLG